jgi:hypothetical protein
MDAAGHWAGLDPEAPNAALTGPFWALELDAGGKSF